MRKGESGERCVRGQMSTQRYFNRPDSTQAAKITDRETGDVYHRMGDTGYEDDSGRLWFCGRKTHRVVLKNETLFTVPCERIFNTHPKVRRTALVGVKKASGLVPVLCVELSATELPSETVRKELIEIGSRFRPTQGSKTILFNPNFPGAVRHTAKLFREHLAVWAPCQLP